MTEHISRADDERLYQPRIHSALIRRLYLVKLATGIPLTVLVDRAIRDLLAQPKNDEGDPPTSHS